MSTFLIGINCKRSCRYLFGARNGSWSLWNTYIKCSFLHPLPDFGWLDPGLDPIGQKRPTERMKKFHVWKWWMFDFDGWEASVSWTPFMEVRDKNVSQLLIFKKYEFLFFNLQN
jgi:hypothetical protein